MVNDTHASTLCVEDAVTRLFTFKTGNALTVDSHLRKLENITGLRKPLREEAKDSEEPNTYDWLQEKPATVSDSTLPLKLNREETCN